MEAVQFDERPELHRPVLITAFKGWNDAGESATAAATFLRDRWEARGFARIDPEDFFDFQVTRPVVKLVDGVSRVIDWPACEFHYAKVEGRDVVLFLGIEPNVRWRTFATSIVDAARALGVERVVTLGAFLADVPHTRAVPVVGSAPSVEDAARLGLQASRYEGPTGIVGVLHDMSNKAGVPSVSFWAAVPHYVPAGVNPKATMALIQQVATFIDVDVDAGELLPAAESWEQRVNELVSENDVLAEYVHRLEEAGGEDISIGNLPSGDALAAEIERFLKERGGS